MRLCSRSSKYERKRSRISAVFMLFSLCRSGARREQQPQHARDLVGRSGHLAPGEPHAAVAMGGQPRVTSAVTLEGSAGGVHVVAVGLRYHILVDPLEVALE